MILENQLKLLFLKTKLKKINMEITKAPSEKMNLIRLGCGAVVTIIAISAAGTFIIFLKNNGVFGTHLQGSDGMTLLYVPGSEFTMGSDDGNPDEKPAHKVTLKAFWIDRTEVSNQMYSGCVNAGVCRKPTDNSSGTRLSYFDNPDFANYPVVQANWVMAETYCRWAGRRLPTEAEWEKAARGNDARSYPWGETAPNAELLNYNNIVGDTNIIGHYPKNASPYGALDMAGNVAEWVADWYEVYPGGDTSASPDFGHKLRVVRGGAWSDTAPSVRSAYRNALVVSTANSNIGFRCAR